MRRTMVQTMQEEDQPTRPFFVKLFKRHYAEVIVDPEEKDVFLKLKLKKGEEHFSVRQFVACKERHFPRWAINKCYQLYRQHFRR